MAGHLLNKMIVLRFELKECGVGFVGAEGEGHSIWRGPRQKRRGNQ